MKKSQSFSIDKMLPHSMLLSSAHVSGVKLWPVEGDRR